MKRRKGVSLTEYGLIASIAAIVGLQGLLWLGQELSKSASSMLPEKRNTSVAITAVPTQSLPVNEPISQPVSANSSNTSILAVPPILSTSQLTGAVQTAGVNGTTTMLANSLIAYSDKLKAEGAIDESTYNDIVGLANQGHALARVEASLEAAAKAAGDGGGSGFYRTKADLNGKSYSGPDIALMLTSDSPDVKAFLALQSKVLNNASLNDPALKSVLSQLSNNILNVANASAESADWMSQDGGGINNYDSFMSDIPDMIAEYSSKTKGNSNDICSTQRTSTACQQ